MYEKFSDFLKEESGSTMSTTILGPEVVSLPQIKDAIQSELINMGNALPLYFAADFPRTGVAGDLALMGRSPHAMTLAMTEFGVFCAECQAEFKKFGGVFLGAGGSDVYALLTTKPVRTTDDLRGLRLRSGGAPFSRWAEHFGATPVNLPVGETFEAMSQGTIDGTMASIVDMLSFRLVDVAKYVTVVPLGTYHVTSNFTVASATWKALSVEDRTKLVAAANRGNPQLTDRWAFQLPTAARKAVADKGIEVIEPDAALLAASDAFAMADSSARIAADPLAAEYAALVEKWTAIVAELGDNPEALAARAKDEIWARVDLATYGQKPLAGPFLARQFPKVRLMLPIPRAATALCRLMSLIGAAAVLAMMLHICLDVALRNLFRVSMNTTPEIVARYYMVGIAFLPLGWLHLRGQMIAVEVLDFLVPPRFRPLQGLVVALAGAALYAVLARASLTKALREAGSGTFVELVSFKLPVWHSFFLPAAGFALAAIACLLVALAAVLPQVRAAIEEPGA